MATRKLPDVEYVVTQYLLRRSEVTDICGQQIGTQLDLTKDAALPAVRIRRVSLTTPVPRHLRAANMQFESWAADELAAQDLAETVQAVMLDELDADDSIIGNWPAVPDVDPRKNFDGAVVTGTTEAIGPRPQSDPDTDTPRWLSSVVIFCHPVLGSPL